MLANRIGSPIIHPDDPRKVYQQQQAALMHFFRELWDVPEMPIWLSLKFISLSQVL